jgi:hypothetical protein
MAMTLKERRAFLHFVNNAPFRRKVVNEAHRRGIGKHLDAKAGNIMLWFAIIAQLLPIIMELFKKENAKEST